MKVLLALSSVLILAGLGVLFKFANRAGYESPDYRVQLESGRFEIREYPSMMLGQVLYC